MTRFHYRGIVQIGLEKFLHLVVDVLGGEAELLVENLVGGRETETGEAPDVAVSADKSF